MPPHLPNPLLVRRRTLGGPHGRREQKNNFHALLEATKSIPNRIQPETGQTGDGAELVQATLTNASGPLLTINAGRTATGRREQSGFANLVAGLLGL